MTCAEILAKLKAELQSSLELIDKMHVHDARVQGQRESLQHVQTVLGNLCADLADEPEPVTPAVVPVKKKRPATRTRRMIGGASR